MKKILIGAFLALFAIQANSAEVLSKKTIDFYKCNNIVNTMTATFPSAQIAKTKLIRIEKLYASDGSLIVTCSKLDRTMSIIKGND